MLMSIQQKEKSRARNAKKYSEKNLSLKNVYTDKAERACLMCGKKFISRGPHNRRCQKCNQKIDQAAENTFYMPTVYANDGGSVGEFVPIVE
jgi:tRNA(Ile2) C34 agmatinyltransferase TiaS